MFILFDRPFWRDVDPGMTSWFGAGSSRGFCTSEPGEEFLLDSWLDVGAYKQDFKHHLLALFWTSDKYWAENKSDEWLKAQAIRVLEDYYGESKVPRPIGFKTSRWRSDPFARCSYSGIQVFSSDQEWKDLARPESLSLYFAGEHTNFDGRYQTMDGAYNTGIREANRVAARPWNDKDGVSQNSKWVNPFAYSSGWANDYCPTPDCTRRNEHKAAKSGEYYRYVGRQRMR